MNKKGFTLIELLAVILILGIISLIAIPVVTNIIEEGKMNALKNTASNILSITEDYVTIQNIKGLDVGTKKFSFPNNDELDIKSQPKNGFIRVITNENYEIAIDDGKYCAYKNYNTDEIEVVKLETNERCDSKLTYKDRGKSYLKKYYHDEDGVYDNSDYIFTEFKSYEYLNKIIKIDFLYDATMPGDAIASWDLSEEKDNSIIGWITSNNSNSSFYDLTISSNNDIYANPDSTNWFGDMEMLQIINFDNFNTSDVILMDELFFHNYSLLSLDLSDFNTSKVTSMYAMFNKSGLVSLDLSSFNTENVKYMNFMFYNNTNLRYVDISSFRTPNLLLIRNMFDLCPNIENVDLHNFDTSNVTNMRFMFSNDEKLKSVNMRGLNTENVEDMSGVFCNCISLTELDLTSFNTKKVTNTSSMFINTPLLKTIYATTDFIIPEENLNMFGGCGTSSFTIKDKIGG